MRHIQTVAGANILAKAHTPAAGRMPDQLPERVQNLLHRSQPILPEPRDENFPPGEKQRLIWSIRLHVPGSAWRWM